MTNAERVKIYAWDPARAEDEYRDALKELAGLD